MIKIFIAIMTIILTSTAIANTLIPVNIDMFEAGNYWVWEYKTAKGEHNSFEKYLVLSKSGSNVTFEMQSQLAGDRTYNAHHRFTVDIDKCLENYKDYSRMSTWQLESFKYKSPQGNWTDAGFTHNTQVFEEKFNCHQFVDANNYRFRHTLRDGQLDALGDVVYSINQDLFPRKGHTDSMFIFQPYDMASIAGFKVFNPGKGDHEYFFELVEWQMD